MLTITQIKIILNLQNSINNKINKSWLTSNIPHLRGTLVETTEAMDPQYKWWKSGEEDIKNIQVELIDILHFNASHMINEQGGNIDSAAELIFNEMTDNQQQVVFDTKHYLISEMDSLARFELMAGLSASRRISWPLFFSLCDDYELDGSAIFKIYVGKNVLNTFRQDFGYQDGTYNKECWSHEGTLVEDNVVLHYHLDNMDFNSENFSNELYERMKQAYPGSITPNKQK